MKKLSSLLIAALFALFAPVAMADTDADIAAAFTKGSLVHVSYQGNFTYSADSVAFVLQLTNRPLNVVGYLSTVGGAKVLLTGPVIFTNRGTASPKAWNPNTIKTNWMGIKASVNPAGTIWGTTVISNTVRTQGSARTNGRWFVPAGSHVVIPVPRIYLKGTYAYKYIFTIQNSHTTNCNYGVEFDIWQ